MKNKMIIVIVVLSVLVLCGVGFFTYKYLQPTTVVTLDINPSIELLLNRKNVVKKVTALNDDAKEIITDNIKDKDIKSAIDIITTNVIDKGFAKDNFATVIVYSKGISSNEIQKELTESFQDKNVGSKVIIVDSLTEEDKELAKKYGISEAKAAVINQITEEKENIAPQDLIEKPVNELDEAKEKGIFCDDGYTLEGDFCTKAVGREPAKEGNICPENYLDYKGTCYEEIRGEVTDKLICAEGRTLEEGICVHRMTTVAIPLKYECTKGEAKTRLEVGLTSADAGDANNIVCVDLSKATHPVSPCELNDGTEWKRANGKCYWHRAGLLPSGCPGKIRVGNECWDDASNILICKGARDGKQYKSRDEYCENSIKYLNPTITEYTCEEGFTLEDKKCIKIETEEAMKEIACPEGYTKIENERCINKNKTIDKISGYYCEQHDSRLEGKECILMEIKNANRS